MVRLLAIGLLLKASVGAVPGGEAAPEPKGPPEPAFPPVTGLAALRGDIRPLYDGRVELYYDWSDPAQLADWRVEAGPEPRVADGELRLGSAQSHLLRHAASFLGAAEAAGAFRIEEELAPHGHCGVALCAGPWRGYWLHLRDWRQELYREGAEPAFAADGALRLRPRTAHSFHFARTGNWLRVWLDHALLLRGADPAFHQGSVLLRAWRARVGFRGLWLLGRPDPQWLAANPGVERQLEALRLYQGALPLLRPLWEAGQHAEALARAKALAAQEPYAKSPLAAKWLLADAQALAALWQAVEAGIAKLKPGDAIRAGGAEAAFQEYRPGLLLLRANGADAPKKLASLQGDELLALAARARPAEPARDQFVLALLRLHAGGADRAAALPDLLLAAKAGADIARHRGLLIPRPPTAEKLAPPQAISGERAAFDGKPLFIEAEAAAVRAGALVVEQDAAASGGRFVWEPRGEGDAQYGKPSSRLVFHVLANQPATAYLWARVRSPSADANSFFFALAPEGTETPNLRPWHLAPQAGWHWEPYNAAASVDEGSTKPSAIQLRPGINAIVIAVRERGVALDRLYLSESPDPPER
ncbi:MAG: hypothetical protein FJ291_07095 [Planctomycetes bacterium]|nr:hypothetical protein [Planctomycetota bacterium]